MANAIAPRGLVPVRHTDNSVYVGPGSLYWVPATDANQIFVGDPVVVTGQGDANGVPSVTLATAGTGNYITGAMMGIVPGGGPILPELPITRDMPVYRQANVGQYILVADEENVLFEIQEDSVGGALTPAACSNNANLIGAAGNTQYGYSGWQLQSSSVATTATLQLRIMRAVQRVDNTIGTNTKWYVRINLHSIRNPTGV